MSTEAHKFVESLVRLIDGYKNARKNRENDKLNLGFNVDNYHMVTPPPEFSISLDGYVGRYGNSSCSTLPSVPKEFWMYLLKYLNRNIVGVLEGVLSEAYKDVEKSVKKRLESLEKEMNDLRSLQKRLQAEKDARTDDTSSRNIV